MSNYHAPLDDMRFALRVHGMLDEILALPACADLDADTIDAVLEEAAKFAAADWAQSNVKGDKNGAKIKDGVVTVDESSRAVYNEFCDAGWVSLRMPQEFGGQGLPTSVAALTDEMWYAGNLALSLMPLLTGGAISAIATHASEELKQKFIPKMAEGVWSGTMNLTEPQAGTDLALLASKAVPKENGAYAITGQKIFITWGEHELTENIIHLVLARLPDAPAGTKGISLFIVPKFLVNEDGSVGARNSLQCVSIEHKMGIHGSPTCVMQFDGAEGYLVGEPHSGLKAMFTMMNHARLGVGIEGVGVADRAFRHAHAYTQERIQSRDIAGTSRNSVSIIHHPDVRRMLLVQKATIEAERAMYLRVAALLDKAHGHPDPAEAKKAQALVDFMIPVIKTFCTENGVTLTNMAMQCFGGMGYVEETGAAQFVRDVRITPIYEGTNGVQALDFIGRKTAMNGGETAMMIQQEAVGILKKLQAAAPDLAEQFKRALDLAEKSVIYILTQFGDKHPEKAAAGSFAYTMQMSATIGAGEMARAYLAAEEALQDSANALLDENFYRNKQNTVRVYFAYILPQVETYAAQVLHGADSILNIAIDDI